MRFLRLKLLLALIFMVSYHFGWQPGVQWTVLIAVGILLFEFIFLR
jgi:glucose-6-phosphate-specific signal transduction histidine kinase